MQVKGPMVVLMRVSGSSLEKIVYFHDNIYRMLCSMKGDLFLECESSWGYAYCIIMTVLIDNVFLQMCLVILIVLVSCLRNVLVFITINMFFITINVCLLKGNQDKDSCVKIFRDKDIFCNTYGMLCSTKGNLVLECESS